MYRERGSLLFVNGGRKKDGGAEGVIQTLNYTVRATVRYETAPVEVWYYSGTDDSSLTPLIKTKVAKPSSLSLKLTNIVHTITNLSNTEFDPDWNVQMHIEGIGFFNSVNVTIGGLQVNRLLLSYKQMQLLNVPSAAQVLGMIYESGVVTFDDSLS